MKVILLKNLKRTSKNPLIIIYLTRMRKCDIMDENIYTILENIEFEKKCKETLFTINAVEEQDSKLWLMQQGMFNLVQEFYEYILSKN